MKVKGTNKIFSTLYARLIAPISVAKKEKSVTIYLDEGKSDTYLKNKNVIVLADKISLIKKSVNYLIYLVHSTIFY